MTASSPVVQSGRDPLIYRDVAKPLLFKIFEYLGAQDLAQFIIACNKRMVFSNGTHRFQVDVYNGLGIGFINSEIVKPEEFRKRVVKENDLVPHLRKVGNRGCLELIQIIITSLGKAEKLSARCEAIIGAASSGKLEIIQALADANIPYRQMCSAVYEAARGGHLSCITSIRASCKQVLFVNERRFALRNAAQGGHLACIPLLYNNQPLPINDLVLAVSTGAGAGQLLFIQTLLNSSRISETSRDQAVIQAAQYGHHLCLRFLLDNGSTSQRIKEHSLNSSAERGFPLCIEVLLEKYRWFSSDSRKNALILAVNGGHLACVKMLLNGLKEKPAWVELVIKAAYDAEKIEIAAYLETWKPEEQKGPS